MDTFVCEACTEIFPAEDEPMFDTWCGKCKSLHILCPACWYVHSISASQESRYLANLEAS